MTKKIVVVFLVICILVSLILSGCAQTTTPPIQLPSTSPQIPAKATESIKFKAIQFLNVGHIAAKPFKELVDRINEAAKGRLVIGIAGGPELVGQPEQAEALRNGSFDVAYTPWAYFRAMVPVSTVIQMMRIDQDELLPGKQANAFLVEEFEKANIRLLCEGAFGSPFYMFTVKPVPNAKALTGLRMRSSAAFPFLETLGLVPITLEHGDTYTAIERGMLDGCPNKNDSIKPDGLCGLLKYQVGPKFWGNASIPIVINGNAWKRLPKELQDLIIDETVKYQPVKKKGIEAFLEGGRQAIKECKIEHIEWSAEDNKWMVDTIDNFMFKRFEKAINPDVFAKYKKLFGFDQ